MAKVAEVLVKRRSIRRFNQDKELDEETIEVMIEAAQWAPSAGNLQSYKLVMVRDQKTKAELAQIALGQSAIAQAAVVWVASADLNLAEGRYGERGSQLFAIQDATLALYNIWLQVTEVGWGAVWVGSFDEREVRELLGLEMGFLPVGILAIGWPAEIPEMPSRRPVEEVLKRVE